jgi:hypothetical protein
MYYTQPGGQLLFGVCFHKRTKKNPQVSFLQLFLMSSSEVDQGVRLSDQFVVRIVDETIHRSWDRYSMISSSSESAVEADHLVHWDSALHHFVGGVVDTRPPGHAALVQEST